MNNKRHLLTVIAAALLAIGATAQTARKFTWTNSTDSLSKVEAYLPDHPTGRAVVCLPGGGYAYLAMDHEGRDWAGYFNRQGIAFFVLAYRMPKGDRNIPLSDAYNAIRTVRDSAAQWHVNPLDVGIMGFSAGGHLASAVSTHADWTVRPNFSILFYPVVSMDENDSHKFSILQFLGEGRHDKALVKDWSNFNRVQRHLTPPAIILLANDDWVVPPVTNGVAYYSAMRKAGNDCALYVYPSGGHGFGIKTDFAYHSDMLNDLSHWLRHLPSPKPGAVRVACIGNSITDGDGLDMRDLAAYPAQMQQVLGNDYVVKNFGVSGCTVLNKGDRPYMNEEAWHDALCFRPDVAIIKLGTNDSKPWNWTHKAEFAANLQTMVDSLKALPSKPKIILATPVPALTENFSINDSVITNGIVPVINKVARKNHLRVLDMHTLFPRTADLMQADGIHPNQKGAARMAQLIGEAIRKL